MSKTRADSSGENRARSAASLSAADLTVMVKRLGYVAAVMHRTLMSRLIRDADDELAEEFNDKMKPVVDWLMHFELEGSHDAQE